MSCNRVFDRLLPDQLCHTRFFLLVFFLQPDLVPALDWPDPGLTRQAESGFKTMKGNINYNWGNRGFN